MTEPSIEMLTLQDGTLTIGDHTYHLENYSTVCILGAGNAAADWAGHLEQRADVGIHSGLIALAENDRNPASCIKLHTVGFPTPDDRNIRACNDVVTLITRNRRPDTLFLFLQTKDAADLLTAPIPDITLPEKLEALAMLQECGATPGEIDTIRKHLSGCKGGRLARPAHPSKVINLIIDKGTDAQPRNRGDFFSGDSTTWSDCLAILGNYDLLDRIPKQVFNKLFQGHQGFVKDTPHPREKWFTSITTHHIGPIE